ncbi:hypothetical protein ACIA5G_19020 [Amycolatopsis sp. NPDC051758]|uniref:hypothetical protein n=1 Tax=Amycolatopsis sp. NPDC051758 TaxID=3363935 RepID=UPI0037AE95A6
MRERPPVRRSADPSEDGLFMLIETLDHADNTHLVVEPADESMTWYASVGLLDDGAYEVEYRDPRHREHEVTVEAEIGPIARQLISWLGGRHFPGNPTSRGFTTTSEGTEKRLTRAPGTRRLPRWRRSSRSSK